MEAFVSKVKWGRGQHLSSPGKEKSATVYSKNNRKVSNCLQQEQQKYSPSHLLLLNTLADYCSSGIRCTAAMAILTRRLRVKTPTIYRIGKIEILLTSTANVNKANKSTLMSEKAELKYDINNNNGGATIQP